MLKLGVSLSSRAIMVPYAVSVLFFLGLVPPALIRVEGQAIYVPISISQQSTPATESVTLDFLYKTTLLDYEGVLGSASGLEIVGVETIQAGTDNARLRVSVASSSASALPAGRLGYVKFLAVGPTPSGQEVKLPIDQATARAHYVDGTSSALAVVGDLDAEPGVSHVVNTRSLRILPKQVLKLVVDIVDAVS